MAYSPPPERKTEALAAIKALIKSHEGDQPPAWTPLYAKFPEIARSTIFRWAKNLWEETPSRRDLGKAYKAIEERVENGVVDHLPAVPSPAAIAKGGEQSLRKLDFAAEIHNLYSDALMLRTFSVKDVTDEAGETVERIKNPVAFEKSIKARAGLIETSLKILQEVWDMRAMQRFNELIVEEIGLESPECQKRILQRLALLNQRNGINLHGMSI